MRVRSIVRDTQRMVATCVYIIIQINCVTWGYQKKKWNKAKQNKTISKRGVSQEWFMCGTHAPMFYVTLTTDTMNP